MPAISSVNRRGRIKKLQIGHKAKENKQKEMIPSKVTNGRADVLEKSHFSLDFRELHDNKLVYKKKMRFKPTPTMPRYNGTLLIRPSRHKMKIKLECPSPKYMIKTAEAIQIKFSTISNHVLFFSDEVD